MRLITYYTDSHTYLYENYFISSIKDDFEILCKIGDQISPDGNYFTTGFNETTKNKILFLFESLSGITENEFVLFSDVDIIFLNPISDYIKEYMDYDMVFQKGFGGLNTGFFILKNIPEVRNLLNSVVENCHHYHDDQIALNKLINKFNINYTTFNDRIMCPATVIGSKIWTDEQFIIPEETLVFHACWCAGVDNKIRLLNYVRDYKQITSS
jgi:hypothetical protein